MYAWKHNYLDHSGPIPQQVITITYQHSISRFPTRDMFTLHFEIDEIERVTTKI